MAIDQSAPADQLRFLHVAKRTTFSGTAAGYKAAVRACEALDSHSENGRIAPIGKVYSAFTVERLTLQSAECWPDNDFREFMRGRPIHTTWIYAVIEWSAIEKMIVPCDRNCGREAVLWIGTGAGECHLCRECYDTPADPAADRTYADTMASTNAFQTGGLE